MSVGPIAVAIPNAGIQITGNQNDGSQVAGWSQSWIEPNFAQQMRDVANVTMFESIPTVSTTTGFTVAWTAFIAVLYGYRIAVPAGSTTVTGTTSTQQIWISLQLLISGTGYVTGVQFNCTSSSNPGTAAMNFITGVPGSLVWSTGPVAYCSVVKGELVGGATWGKVFRSAEDTNDATSIILAGATGAKQSFIGQNCILDGGSFRQCDATVSSVITINEAVANNSNATAWKMQAYYNANFNDVFFYQFPSTGWVGNNKPNLFQANNTTTWTTMSDERTKDLITDDLYSIDIVRNMKYHGYRHNGRLGSPDDGEGKMRIGLFAGELQKIMPDAINEVDWQGTDIMTSETNHRVKTILNDIPQAHINNTVIKLVKLMDNVNAEMMRMKEVARFIGVEW